MLVSHASHPAAPRFLPRRTGSFRVPLVLQIVLDPISNDIATVVYSVGRPAPKHGINQELGDPSHWFIRVARPRHQSCDLFCKKRAMTIT